MGMFIAHIMRCSVLFCLFTLDLLVPALLNSDIAMQASNSKEMEKGLLFYI